MSKEIKNIEVVKVNPYEIAKARDIDEGFRNITTNLSSLTHYLFGQHTHKIGQNAQGMMEGKGKVIKDFIIGGGLEEAGAGSGALHLLPIIAFNRFSGIMISNGYDYEDKPIVIQLSHPTRNDDVYKEIYKKYKSNLDAIDNIKCARIVSIYIGLEDDMGEEIVSSEVTSKDSWAPYQKEWRAHALGGTEFISEQDAKPTQHQNNVS